MAVKKQRVSPDIEPDIKEHILAQADKGPLSKRDLTLLHNYRDQRMLTLMGVHSESLDFLDEWTNLRSLIMYHCQVADFAALTRLKNLQKFFYNHYITNPFETDFSFLSVLKQVECLGIGNLPHLRSLPDLSKCKRLKRLQIFGCKRLSDIDSVSNIPKLESFSIVNTPQSPRDLEKIMAMKTLKKMSAAFGKREKNEQFRQLLEKHGVQYG